MAFDLITNALRSEIYAEDEELIIDECMTFILGGTHTTAPAMFTTIFYLSMAKHHYSREKVLQEISAALESSRVRTT